jgi:putative aldouronate transport system permease protein
MGQAIKQSRQDVIFTIINYTLLTILLILILYPLYFTIIASFSEPNLVGAGKVWFYPKQFTLEGYQKLFQEWRIWLGYRNTIFYTTLGTFVNLLFTLPVAYALSKREFMPRNIIMFMFVFTMFFNGGMIPTYLVVQKLGLIDSIWAMIIPKAAAVGNIIIARTFFVTNIPKELEDAASIDGCSNTRFFVRIVLPLSKAIIAALTLFYAVGHWNSFFDALIYLRTESKFPLQMFIREILVINQMNTLLNDHETMQERQRTFELIKYTIVIVANLPILIIYPLLQKHFVKGVMLGSIKG